RRPDSKHLQGLLARDCFFGMPAFSGKTLLVLARDGGIKLDHRLAAFDWCVGAARHDDTRLDETLPRVRARKSLHSQAARREKQVTDRVRWLHRGNDAELCEARKVGRTDDLSVL